MYSCGPIHTDEQRQDDQLEHTYSSSVLIQDVVQKNCLKQWTIEKGGEKGSGISVLMVWHDDDDDYTYRLENCIHNYILVELFLKIFIAQDPTEYESFSNISIWPIDETPIGLRGPGSNGNKEIL